MVLQRSSWSRGFDEHPDLGGGAGAAVDDPHLEIHQPHGVQIRVKLVQGLAKGVVQGADRAVSFGGGDLLLARRRIS